MALLETPSVSGRLSPRRSVNVTVNDFGGGVNTLFSETRLKKNEAKAATNLMLVEDGVWDKRWGTSAYPSGVTWTNRPDGASEYRKSDGTRELIVVADGSAWRVDVSAGTKTQLTGASFTQGTRVYFLQSANLLYVSNGVDVLARYNGTSFSTYTTLATPTGQSLARGAGLSAGGFTYYYRVTAANDVGETLGSTETSITVNKVRDLWVPASNEYLDFTWNAVVGATRYVVYMADAAGFEVKLAESPSNSYRDTGVDVLNPYVEPPTDNTTIGPKFGPTALSGNRIWGVADPSNPWRVYFTGTGVNLGNFAPAYGGGWVDLEKGSRVTVTTIKDFQGKVHVFCQTADGKGAIWQIALDTVEIADTRFVVPVPTKITSSIGTSAPRSVVHVENDIYCLNVQGVFTLGNEPGVLSTVLRTTELSAKIRPYFRTSIYQGSIDKSCGYYFDAKVFFSVPTASGEPNRTIVFDRERGAWIADWTVGVSQFLEFTDSGGTTRLLGISSNKLVDFSSAYEGDQGTAFAWRYTSPRFPASTDWTKFARITRALTRFRNTKGSIDVNFGGTGKTSTFSTLVSSTVVSLTSKSGIGFDKVGTFKVGTTLGTPTFVGEEGLIRYLAVPSTKRLIRDIQFDVSGDGLADRATIIGIMAIGKETETALPLSWKAG